MTEVDPPDKERLSESVIQETTVFISLDTICYEEAFSKCPGAEV